MTPEGDNDERSGRRQPGEADDDRRPSPSLAPDLGWGDDNRSSQPPGERITWDEPTVSEAPPSAGGPSVLPPNIPPPPGAPGSAPTPAFGDTSGARPTVRAPRADDEGRRSTPFTLRRPPTPPPPPVSGPGPDAGLPPALAAREEPPAAPPTAPPAPPAPPAPRTPPTPPASASSSTSPPTPPPPPRAADRPAGRPATLRPDPLGPDDRGAEVAPEVAEEVDTLKEQLRALAGLTDPEPPAPPAPSPSSTRASAPVRAASSEDDDDSDDAGDSDDRDDRGATPRPIRPVADRGPSLAGLAEQLVAAQSQIAAIGAQLTTLSHRLSYDLERTGQTMSERLQRDLSNVSAELRRSVSADLGPAIDDLTDQVESDRSELAKAIESAQDALGTRLASIGEVVDAQPLRNVEILSALQGLSSDLEDRLERLAGRIGDQVVALERATNAEITRLRSQVDELRSTLSRPSLSAEALDRMAGQVERLVQRTPSAQDLVESLELLVSEHMEVLRDNVDTRVAALAPALREELEAVRSESLAGMASAEEQLGERLEVLEATLAERMDLALADQVDAIEALVADRHTQLLDAVTAEAPEPADDPRLDETASAAAAAVSRLDDVIAGLAELRDLVASRAESTVSEGAVDADAMAKVADELKALRRRISLRFESEASGGLTPEQIAALAAQISDHLH